MRSRLQQQQQQRRRAAQQGGGGWLCGRTLLRALLFGAVALTFAWTVFIFRFAGSAAAAAGGGGELGGELGDKVRTAIADSSNLRGSGGGPEDDGAAGGPVVKENCAWLEDLLARKAELAIGDPLPEPGVARGGVTFWLKRPMLHTRDPVTGTEIMVLMYNVYNKEWTQHTDKFTNTVKVLSSRRAAESDLFPKLFGYCRDIGGFHYIAVEYLDYDVDRMPRPTSLEQCVHRAELALGLFARLDEEHHLQLSDFKPGQWMARKDGSLVLQDVDDILPPRSKSPYPDQVEWLQNRLQGSLGVSLLELDRAWQTTMFPRGELSVRYTVLNTRLLLDNIGFKWHRDCHESEQFRDCRMELMRWTQTLGDDWPSPAQVLAALQSCHERGSFERTKRPPAAWRDLEPMPLSDYVPTTACERKYDKPEAGNAVKMCEHSCCRAKGGSACYYTAPMELCSRG